MAKKRTDLEIAPPNGWGKPVYVGQGDDAPCLRDFGPYNTEVVRDLLTHLELVKHHVDSMYQYADSVRFATFASHQAVYDLIRYTFVFPKLLHDFGSLLQCLDAIRFGEVSSTNKKGKL